MRNAVGILLAFLCLTASGCQAVLDNMGAKVEYNGSIDDHEQRGVNQTDAERNAHEDQIGDNLNQ